MRLELAGPAAGPARRAAGAGVVLAVLAGHGWLGLQLPELMVGEGAGPKAMRRIEVAFVRELAPTQPAPAAPAKVQPAAPKAAVAAPAALPASAPKVTPESEAVPEPRPEPRPEQQEPAPPQPALAESLPQNAPMPEPAQSAVAPTQPSSDEAVRVAEAASAPRAASFDWPPSTRLTYALNGYFRGDVQGQAKVEWVRQGARYQVHLEATIGPSFAPLVSRRMSSDGVLGPQGLQPRQYEEETRQVLRSARRRSVSFEPQRVVLPNGKEYARPPGVQDTASQFVQLTYLFSLRPELLKPGQTLQVPLALPSNLDNWVFDVRERVVLDTPMGPVETYHVKPRREARAGGDLTAEMWFAPALQYLPIRIKIRQDAETYIDLMLQRAPQQSAPP